MAGILNHRALDLRRRSGRRSAETLIEGPAGGLDPAELVADQELTERINAVIEALESPHREVLSLRVAHGPQATAIAQTLGRAPGTVRMPLERGLERLRQALPEKSSLLGFSCLEPVRGLDAVQQVVLAEAERPSRPRGLRDRSCPQPRCCWEVS